MHALFWPDCSSSWGAHSETSRNTDLLNACRDPPRGISAGAVRRRRWRHGAAAAQSESSSATPRSKLPRVGTTIFTVMSRRARELNAINLGQGFPDYDIDPRLSELVTRRCAPAQPVRADARLPELRQAIAAKLERSYRGPFDRSSVDGDPRRHRSDLLHLQALVGSGDEVVVFDPAYDSYEPAMSLAGARCIHVPLLPPHFRYDWDRIERACSARTRLIIINSPHNPGCKLCPCGGSDALADLARSTRSLVLSDEVYEHIVLTVACTTSVLSQPELRTRSVVVFSFGKTLHATGYA